MTTKMNRLFTLVEKLENKLVQTDEDLDVILDSRANVRVQTLNLQHLHLALKSEEFLDAISAADFVTADGWPVQMLFPRVSPSRVTGSDYVSRLISDPARQQRIGLLGASNEVGDLFAGLCSLAGKELCFREHGLVADWSGQEIASQMSGANVKIALVAVSPPHGEIIANQIRQQNLGINLISVGGSIDMAVGRQVRASHIWQVLKLEWLVRFIGNPRRLARRYFVEGLPFFVLVLLPAAWLLRVKK